MKKPLLPTTTSSQSSQVGNNQHYWLFFLFLIIGTAIIAVELLSQSNGAAGIVSETIVVGVLLASSISMKRSLRFERYWSAFFAFFVSATVVLLRTLALTGVASYYGGSTSSFSAQALIAISVFLVTVLPIIILTKASGASLASIFLKKGDLQLGLGVGVPTLVMLFFGILIGFQLLYGNSHGIQFSTLLSASPLVLIAAALNASNEELWFRGLFLKKFEPFFGMKMSNLLQAPVFMLAHVEMQYSQFGDSFLILFLVLVFIAGLGFGYFMQKSESIIGPTLAHIGADVGIYLPLLLSLLPV